MYFIDHEVNSWISRITSEIYCLCVPALKSLPDSPLYHLYLHFTLLTQNSYSQRCFSNSWSRPVPIHTQAHLTQRVSPVIHHRRPPFPVNNINDEPCGRIIRQIYEMTRISFHTFHLISLLMHECLCWEGKGKFTRFINNKERAA